MRIMEMKLPNRQSIRMKGWNYAAPGYYFVTCNTHGNRALFGVIVNGRMVLSEAGQVAEACWKAIPTHFPNAQIDEFVIMPNHVHGLLKFRREGEGGQLPARTLGDVVGAYKAAVSRMINQRGEGGQLPTRTQLPGLAELGKIAIGASAIWHRNYWDVIVRDEKALFNIRHYILSNPRNYEVVMNIGEPRMLGNKALLDMPKMGFLASRGEATPHGSLPVKSGEAILSGFLSTMERAVFKAGLDLKKPMIWVKPWGLEEDSLTALVRRAIKDGHLLVLSPFSDVIEAPSVRRAAWCNQYVLAHCHRLVIGHLNPDGMLACVLSEAEPEKEIVYLCAS